MVDESVKFAWAYLLLRGRVTTGEWSYYGGCWQEVKDTWDFEKRKAESLALQEKVTKIGINWRKTGVPEVTNESAFTDTFSDSESKLATLGRLFLKNGEEILIGSSDEDAAHLAETARKIMQGKESDVTLLAEKL